MGFTRQYQLTATCDMENDRHNYMEGIGDITVTGENRWDCIKKIRAAGWMTMGDLTYCEVCCEKLVWKVPKKT